MANFNILANLKKAINEIEQSLYPTLKDVINTNESVLRGTQSWSQMFQGQDSRGISISPSYHEKTIAYKKRKKQPFDRVTLRDTGDFYKSISFSANSKEMIIESKIEYAEDLIDKYGIDIFGLQEPKLEEFCNNYILPSLTNKITDIINKNAL